MKERDEMAGNQEFTPRSIQNDLDSYLDGIAGATGIFRAAVDNYLVAGPDGGCWQQAKQIAEHIRALDDLQQKLEVGARAQWIDGALVSDMADPLTRVGRMLKEMKRQITGFAIESGFSSPGRRVPAHLLADMQALAEEVCAAVYALIARYRPSLAWWGDDSTEAPLSRGVEWYEKQADRRSMRLLKTIFADDTMDVETKLPLAQLVEELDRVADHAVAIDREVRCAGKVGVHAPGGRASR